MDCHLIIYKLKYYLSFHTLISLVILNRVYFNRVLLLLSFYFYFQPCSVCHKKFANVHRLQRHMISHQESDVLRRFRCEECGKAFKFKHHLKVRWSILFVFIFFVEHAKAKAMHYIEITFLLLFLSAYSAPDLSFWVSIYFLKHFHSRN